MAFFFLDYAINNRLTPFISMQNHYNLIYREEEREMFPTLKVWCWSFFYGSNQYINVSFSDSTLASARSHGLLLLVVSWRAPLIPILFVQILIHITKTTVRAKNRNKLSMRKSVMYASDEKKDLMFLKELRRLLKPKVLAWPNFRSHGSWVKKVFFPLLPFCDLFFLLADQILNLKAYLHPLLE